LVLIAFSLIAPFYASGQIAPGDVRVAVFTHTRRSGFEIALNLDPRTPCDVFESQNASLFANRNYTACFILDFDVLTLENIQLIADRVQNGMGLFFQTNSPAVPYNLTSYALLSPLLPINIPIDENGFSREFDHPSYENINTRQQETDSFLTKRLSFLSFPQLINLTISEAKTGTTVVLTSDRNLPIIIESVYGLGKVIALTTPVRTNSNKHLANWPMFTYMIFSIALELSGISDYEDFGRWQGAPVPQKNAQLIVLLILISIVSITLIGFGKMRQKSKKVPLSLVPVPEISDKAIERLNPDPNLISKSDEANSDLSTNEIKSKQDHASKFAESRTWDSIGFHKPLTGFVLMFFLSLNLLLPIVLIVMYILPTFILQDPAQFGIMFITGNIFSAVFIAGDFGLAQAFDKFVGEEYIKNPREALKYIQFFVWFQMLSGLGQTVIIAMLGLYVIPNSMSMAFMSYQFLLKAFVQWPGIGYLWTHTLKAMQRSDKEQIVSLITLVIFDIAGLAAFSGLFLQIGEADPRIGTVVGAAMGIAISEVVKTFGLLIISGIALNSIDKRFSIWDCFRVDFDRELVYRTLVFGFKSMLANVIFLFGNFAVTLIIMLMLPNYTYWGAFLGSATLLLYPVSFMIILFENMLPTNAEAYGAKCYRLSEVYISYGFKYFGTFGIFLFVLFAFFVNNFLTAILPPLFKPMGYFIGFYAITRVFMSLGDYSRLFLVSINRVGQYVLFVTIEQVFRVLLLLILITRVQSHPEYLLIWGELPGVILKVLLTWLYTNKLIIKVRINWWQTLFAPGIASLIFFGVGLIVNQWYLNAIVSFSGNALFPTILFSFLICTGLSLTLYPFCLGLLGSWDDASLGDFEFAVRHAGPSRLFGLAFFHMTRFGAKKSPLHNKMPISTTGVAEEIALLNELKMKSIKQI
jgi:O-antigen/teichoic acid export membrane protein